MSNNKKSISLFFYSWSKLNLDTKYLPYLNNLFSSSIAPFVLGNKEDIFGRYKYVFNRLACPRYFMGEGESIHRIFGYNRNYCMSSSFHNSNNEKIENSNKYKLRLGIIPFFQEILIEIIIFIFVNIYFILIFIILIRNKFLSKNNFKIKNKKLLISIARSPINFKYLKNLRFKYINKNKKLVILKFFGWASSFELFIELFKVNKENIFIFSGFSTGELINCYFEYLNFLFTKPKKSQFNYKNFSINLEKSLRHIRIISFNTILYEKLLKKIINNKNYLLSEFVTLELKSPFGYIDRNICNNSHVKSITIQTCDLYIDNIFFPPWENIFLCETKNFYNKLKKLNYKKIFYAGSIRYIEKNNLSFEYKPEKFVFCTSPRSIFKNLRYINYLKQYSKKNNIKILILPHPRDFYFLYKLIFYKETISNKYKNRLLSKKYLFITFPSALIFELIYNKRLFIVTNFLNDNELQKLDLYWSNYIGFEKYYGSIFDKIKTFAANNFKDLISSYSEYLIFLEKNDIIPKGFFFKL
tara:strand:- start:4001 stop:5581 length:1581 start_codon:yes stop_codon:yes gene_type:complete